MSLEKIVGLLSGSLSSRKDTFTINKGYIDCELGGTFIPSCGEMLMFSEREFKNPASNASVINNIYDVLHLQVNQIFDYTNASTRLFYEVLKKDSNFDFIELQIRAAGVIEISVVAQTETQNKIAQRQVMNFGPEVRTLALPVIDLLSLPENGSLMLSVRGLSENCYVHGFRWIGKVPASLANMGERIVLIRTFGHKAVILNRLNSFVEALDNRQSAIFKRTLFVVYDAADDARRPVLENQPGGLRLLVLRGPNFGGGGNASLLVSLALRAGAQVPDAVSEILIIDDDAKFDAETLLRQDAFITGRKPHVISTGIIYAASAPTTIQESGGFWGKFYSSKNHGLEITSSSDTRLYLPYLIRHSEDVSNEEICKYIAGYQEIEFSTFIFISFPYQLLRECGAPLPFFLRNDDVEICLRCLQHGGKLTVNPNLQVWHETAHSPISEFYSILHALIINCCYGGLDKSYFYITFMERVAKIAKAGNYVLLAAYELALRKFAQGPCWMVPATIFDDYSETTGQLKEIFSDLYSAIPAEVANARREETDIISLVDIRPKNPMRKTTIFRNIDTGVSYTIDQKKAEKLIMDSLGACIASLNQISLNFDELKESWNSYVQNFDHLAFWNDALDEALLAVEFQGMAYQEVIKSAVKRPLTIFRAGFAQAVKKPVTADQSKKSPQGRETESPSKESNQKPAENLPKGFTRQGYLAHNPDVRESGMDPVEHWLKYGRFESRKF